MVCKLDMLPPPGEAWRAGEEVERERRVAGDVFFKNGHIAFDWRRTASMVAVVEIDLEMRIDCGVVREKMSSFVRTQR